MRDICMGIAKAGTSHSDEFRAAVHMSGQINLFSLDALMKMATTTGLDLLLRIDL